MDYEDLFSNSSSGSNPSNDDELFSEFESHYSGELDLNSFSSGAVDNEIKKARRKKNGKSNILKIVLTTFLIGVITVSIVVGSFLVYAFTAVDGTMDENLNDLKLNFTTTVYVENDDGGWEEYQRLHGEHNRIWISYDPKAAKDDEKGYTGIPQDLVDAFVAIEDKRFYEHDGVDWKRTIKALANEFLHFSDKFGGSTITQQLVKNLTDDRDQKASRKLREIMRARYLEGHYSKDTIIECYLNTIPLGHGIYGVEVAANYYFDKSVDELTLLECATLAAITQSPTYNAPDDYPENNKSRRDAVLREMYDQKLITKEEYDAAAAEELKLVASRDALNEAEVNSYFIDALIRQVTNDISDKYGYDKNHAASNFYSGGYKIYTTLDPEIQANVEAVFNDAETYGLKGKDGTKLQGSFTIMDYRGHVLGLAGGIGEKTVNLGMSGFNRATDAIRQPGSTMKPIAAYAPAVEGDIINYSSLVNDKAYKFNGWTPVNWYKGYWGNITVQYALERSCNSIPVYLADKLGPQTCYDFLTQKLGITTLNNPEDIDYSPLGMGGTNGGITTLESAAAYAVFGNGGLYYEPKLYYKVCDQRGKEILSYEDVQPTVAISEDTATVMNHLLQGVVYGGNGTGKGAAGYIPNMKIYAKTGTSNDSNDLWFVGGTPYYVASCWCGYDSQQTISNSAIAMKMWGAVMSKCHDGLKAEEFVDSAYAVKRYYCPSSGQLATEACPEKSVGWYRKSNIPSSCKTHAGTALGAPSDKPEEESSSETPTEGETTEQNAEN